MEVLKNVNYQDKNTIFILTICLFESMNETSLRALKELSDLKEQIGIEALKSFTFNVMSEVWPSDEELENVLRLNPLLTETVGKELLVLFDNVMSDPDDTLRTGKPQRYTRACLDNRIQLVYDSNLQQSKSTYETVISTYTSPTPFTPQLESLFKTAARLGIDTNDLNLKNFVTERSLAAFLKTIIQAKIKKNEFPNRRLKGVLNHTPNFEDAQVSNKLKNSFSKPNKFIGTKADTKSSPNIQRFSVGNRSMPRFTKDGFFANERDKNFMIHSRPSSRKSDQSKRKCKKCCNDIPKSMSDSYLSLATCESITCQCLDSARKVRDNTRVEIAVSAVDHARSTVASSVFNYANLTKVAKWQVAVLVIFITAIFSNFENIEQMLRKFDLLQAPPPPPKSNFFFF